MGRTKSELKIFLNETFIPYGVKMLRGMVHLEFSREHIELMNEYMTNAHPHARCSCGSNKVINYGLPRNNGRYFHCRTCETFFKTPAYKREWNKIYRTCGAENPIYDFWLDRYDHLLSESRDIPVVDLGAGYGNDTIYLQSKGFKTISCDYSEEALQRLEGLAGSTNALCFDMLDGLPFFNNSFRIIIANLSLHYFAWHDTEQVIGEINRVLKKDGYLFCRVNSTNDTENGAGQGIPIEENYYVIDGKRKRFFNEKQITRLLRKWQIVYCFEHSIKRFGKTKIFWEVAARKC